jgi:hypothetical protein
MKKIEIGQLVIAPEQAFKPKEKKLIVYTVTDIDAKQNKARVIRRLALSDKADTNNEKQNKPKEKSKWIDIDKIKVLHNPKDKIDLLDGCEDYDIFAFNDSYYIIGIDSDTNYFFYKYNAFVRFLYAVIPFDVIQYQIPKMIKEESPAYVWKKIYSMIKEDAKWWLEEPYIEVYQKLRTEINRKAKEKRKIIKDLMKKHNFS